MTKSLLEMVSGELTRLSRSHLITVVEFDEKVHRIYPYTKPLTQVVGRGGTSFDCLFGDLLKTQRPDLVCVFTDGFGSLSVPMPRIPVLWILTPNGKSSAPFGKVIQMS